MYVHPCLDIQLHEKTLTQICMAPSPGLGSANVHELTLNKMGSACQSAIITIKLKFC